MSPVEIAAEVLRVDAGSVRSVERIKHGLTNESWLVRTAHDAVVVRISHPDVEALQIDRASEAVVLATVAAADVGPEVLLCSPERRLLVTRYLGATWTDEMAARPDSIARIGNVLRRLHALPAPPGIHRIALVAVIKGYLREVQAFGSQGTGDTSVRQRAFEIAAALDAGTPCLCHNDVHALNLIDDGQLRMIDWEYAGVGERCFDLASICVYQHYDKRQRQQLLGVYGGDDVSLSRLEMACWLFDYIRELWLLVRSLTSRQQA